MTVPEIRTGTSSTKHHFVVLDGLRGVAAFAIVLFHFMEWVYEPAKNFIGHGFLAVDFFFCLSGFVIAYAYDQRIERIGKRAFFRLRMIRLHPLVILGAVLGLLAYFFDPFEQWHAPIGMVVLLFVSALFLIPMPIMEERAFNIFAFNAPAWSLFWEYIANIAYAFVLHRLKRTVLIILAVLAAIGIFAVGYSAGNLLGGWSKYNWWHGGVRVAFSFLAGMLIFRNNWIIRLKGGFILPASLLVLAFIFPLLTWNWLIEAIIVVFYFPLIVALGAGAMPPERTRRFCLFAGQLSYPLYMTHYAGLWIFGHYYTTKNPPAGELVFVIIGGTIFLVVFAYAVMRWFDIPVRRWLSNRERIKIQDGNQ
jgi:peptidoglycan/LPS O-acetylase OafA/YrhL